MDCLAGVKCLRQVNEPVQMHTEANWAESVLNFRVVQNQDVNISATKMHARCVQDQTKMVVKLNETRWHS